MAPEPIAFLDGWRDWDTPPRARPAIVRKLGGGRSNRSFLLEASGERMALRVNAAEQVLPGTGRGQETRVWRAASEAGIAPPLVHADPDGRFLVSTYIESDLPDRPQDDPALAAQALELLRRTHQLDVSVPAIDYAAHIEAYWQQIESRRLPVDPGLRAQRAPMRQTLAALLDNQAELVPCHHDPVVENFVGAAERLYLLDWEYAARGLVMMDYAALSVEWGIGLELLAERTDFEPASVSQAKSLYRYLCTLWSAVTITE
jgi:thiamine kinase-like enzyme